MEQKKKPSPRTKAALRVARASASPADPLGSYTGRPADPREEPQQDADDL